MGKYETETTSTQLLSNKTYDFLKWVVELLLPGTGALYFGLSQIWGFPNGEAVVGTIALITVFLGGLIGVSRRTYTPQEKIPGGALIVDETDPEKDTFTLEVATPLFELKDGALLSFKVVKP